MASIMVSDQVPLLQSCSSHAFQNPIVFGAEFTNIHAALVTNHSGYLPQGLYGSHNARSVSNLTFCNVSLTYTHPGQNDVLNTHVWLPIEDWNGRLQGAGGGGYQAGMFLPAMEGALDDGFAVVTTDAGNELNIFDPISWAMLSPGNINLYALQNFASVAYNDAAQIGKQITEQFYGVPPKRSYWNGCSTGGRQGLMLAQRYPDAYDGILAAAPAINWPSFIAAEMWPFIIMNELGTYPHPCELNAITAGAVSTCDELDGVKDSIISAPELCDFDPHSLVGTSTPVCPDIEGNKSITITEAAAIVAEAAWTGPVTPEGRKLWHGLSQQAPLTGPFHLASTTCSPDGSDCLPAPFTIAVNWLTQFVYQNHPDFDSAEITRETFADVFYRSINLYNSTIGTADPNLGRLKKLGRKMITWHGLADPVIFPDGTRAYYDSVKAMDPEVEDYYRYFEAPGVEHCASGPGPYPGKALKSLISWVEEGMAPDVLEGTSLEDSEGGRWERDICAYPKKAQWTGKGDARLREGWKCV